MVTTEMIKDLRDRTGLSVMQCKIALEESGGDMDKALIHLKAQGAKVAEKKGDRELGAGVISSYIHATKNVGSIVELGCETDFVAKNPEFVALAYDIAMHACAMNPKDIDEMLTQPFVKDGSMTVNEMIQSGIQKFGENTRVKKFTRFQVGE